MTTVTALASGTASGTGVTSTSATPTAGAMCVVCVGMEFPDVTLPTFTLTNTHAGSWTWTLAGSRNYGAPGTHVAIYWAIVPATPGAGTWTWGKAGGGGAAVGISVFELNDTVSTVQTTGNDVTTNNLTITMGSTPLATSTVVAVLMDIQLATMVQNGSYTQVHKLSFSGDGLQTVYDTVSPANPSWTTLGTIHNTAVAVEFAPASVAGGVTCINIYMG